jgi:hypothetical protein
MVSYMIPQFFVLSVIYVLIPQIISAFTGEPVFKNEYDKGVYFGTLFINFVLNIFNYVLYNSLNQYMYNKMFYQQTVYTMIDN